jgi:hypothetical protein
MLDFVDVSQMSNRQIKMMHRMDEGHTPRQRTWSNRQTQPSVQFSMRDVWAAACAANRVNGGYVKEAEMIWDESTQTTRLIKERNRTLMMQFLSNVNSILDVDFAAGDRCRDFLRNDITFRALSGKLTDFDQAIGKCLAVQDCFDSVKHKLELSVLASLPASAERSQSYQNVEERVKFTKGGLIGKPNDKIQARVEVLNSKFSVQWQCWWIKGITDQDQPVFFSYRENHDVGTWLEIQGTVKAHRDNLTQLNRVKVL